MENFTPFQKALLDSVSRAYIPERKQCRFSTLRRSLIAAAVILALAGSVLAVYRFSFKPEVEHTVIEFPATGKSADSYQFFFTESFAAENAPESIETYYVPSILPTEQLVVAQVWDKETLRLYEPLKAITEENDLPENGAKHIYLQWDTEYGLVGFRQMLARNIEPNDTFLELRYEAPPVEFSYQAEQSTDYMGDYEVFCFQMCVPNGMDDFWFWTDGDYLYSLTLMQSFTAPTYDPEVDVMEQLFDSIVPIESLDSYLTAE